MFGFGKRKSSQSLPKNQANPGVAVEGRIAFSGGNDAQSFNLIEIAGSVLSDRNYKVTTNPQFLEHSDSGFQLLPQFVEIHGLEDGGVQTVSTIQVHHPKLPPAGIFEYQHSAGHSVQEALTKGIDFWVQTDFVTLLASLETMPQIMSLVMEMPATADRPAKVRRAVLGPVAHYTTTKPDRPETRDGEEHPFCSCCMLTRSFEAFSDLIQGDGYYGLRLYAARDANGDAQADCRVNGEEWETGKEALRQYVNTWPEAGFEFRKQYIVLQSVEKLPTAN
jgi:hypothetical protein